MAKAMKAVGAILSVAAFFIPGGQVLAMGLTTAQVVGGVGAAMGLAGGLLDKPRIGSVGRQTEFQVSHEAGIPFAHGRVGAAGVLAYHREFGEENRYQSLVLIHSGGGPINGYVGFSCDDAAVTFSGDAAVTSRFAGHLWRQTRLGDQPDTALTSPTGLHGGATLPGWTSAHKLSGFACSMLTMEENSKGTFYQNASTPPCYDTLEGVLLWDPAQDDTYPGGAGDCLLNDPATWVYTTNPVLHALKWCLGHWHNGVLVGGIGAPLEGIDVQAFVDAAAAVPDDWGVTAWPKSTDDPHQVLIGFLQAGGAAYCHVGGRISCVSRILPKVSLVTVTAADTAGPVEIDGAASMIDRLNTVTPRFMSEAHRWTLQPTEPVGFEAYVETDGRVAHRGVDYPFVPFDEQAGVLGAIDILDSREDVTGVVPFKPHMQRLKVGQCFTFTEPGFVLDGLKCFVLSAPYDPETGVVRVAFRSETAGKHDLAFGVTTTVPAPPSLTPADPTVVPAPVSWDVILPEGGTAPSPLMIVETADDNALAWRMVVETGGTSTGPWTVAGEAAFQDGRMSTSAVAPGATVWVALSYEARNGVPSPRDVKGPFTIPTVVAGGIEGPDGPITGGDILKPRPYAADVIRNTFSDLTGLLAVNATIAATGSGDNALAFTPTSSNPYLQWALGRPGERVHRIRARIRAVGAEITEAMWDGRLTYNITGSNNSTGTGRVATIPYPAGGLPVGEWRDIEWVCDDLIDYLDSANIINVRLRPVTGAAGALHFARIEAGYAGGATANTGALADMDSVGTGQIDPGAVTDQQLGEGAVIPSKLANRNVGANRIIDPDFTDAALITGHSDFTLQPAASSVTDVQLAGKNVLRINAGFDTDRNVYTPVAPVTPGRAYLIGVWAETFGSSNPTSDGSFGAFVRWTNYNDTDVNLGSATIVTSTVNNTGAVYSLVAVAPAGATGVQINLRRHAGLGRNVHFNLPFVQELAALGSGVSLEDGATPATDALLKTDIGTAAALDGAGLGAYADSLNDLDPGVNTRINLGLDSAGASLKRAVIGGSVGANEPPSYYRTNHPAGEVREQKLRSAIGVPGSGTQYGTLTTLVTTISTAYPISQRFDFPGGVYQRQAVDETTWGAWSMMFDRQNRPTFSASDLYETGSTPATNANYKTILGTALALDGEGLLARKDTVGTADLDNNGVTFAKIGAGEAGQGALFNDTGNVSLTNVNEWYDVAEVSITTRAGESVAAYGHFSTSLDTDSVTFGVQGRLLLNGSPHGSEMVHNAIVISGTAYLSNGIIPCAMGSTPGAATHTYKLQARRTGGTGITVSRRYLIAQTFKDTL